MGEEHVNRSGKLSAEALVQTHAEWTADLGEALGVVAERRYTLDRLEASLESRIAEIASGVEGSNEQARKAALQKAIAEDGICRTLREAVRSRRRELDEGERDASVARQHLRVLRLQLALLVNAGGAVIEMEVAP